MKIKFSLLGGVLAACAAASAGTTVVTNASNQIVFTVDEGETNTVSVALPTNLAGLVKEGAGTLALTVANTFTYPVSVNAGYLQPTVDNAIGCGTVTVVDGAAIDVAISNTLQQTSYNRKCSNVKIVGSGPDGQGALRSNGTGDQAGDHMFPLVTLTGDAMFGGKARWGVDTCDLGGHTLTITTPGTYEMFNGNTFVNPGHIRAHKVTFQGAVTMNGGSTNTYTVYKDGGQLNMWGSSKASAWTLKVDENASMRAGGNYGKTNRNLDKWAGPVQVAAGKRLTVSSYDSANNCVQLCGVLSGEGQLYKTTDNTLYIDAASDSTPNTYSGGTIIAGGALYLNRPAALAHYDVPGALTATGSSTLSFYCRPDRWTTETIRTAVNTSTNLAASVVISHNLLSTDPAIVYTEGFNKVVTLGVEGGGELCWRAPFCDDTARFNFAGASSTMTIDYPTTATCPYGYMSSGTLKLQGGFDLNMASNTDFNVGGGRLVISNASLRTTLTASGATRSLNVSSSSTSGAILEILDGAVISNKIQVGNCGTKHRGAVYQRGGMVRHYARGANDAWCGTGSQAYGFYEMTGGTLAEVGGWFGFGHDTSAGVLQMTNGLIMADNFPISRGGYGRMYMSGGTVKTSYTYIGEQQWGGGVNLGNSVITVDGEDAFFQATTALQICQRTNNFQAVLNMNRGVVAAKVIYEPNYMLAQRSASARSLVNFNGGTYRASAETDNIFGGKGYELDRVTVYEKGATIDTDKYMITDQTVPITGATGKGVSRITYSATRTGYIGSPEVYVEGGGGEGATAYVPFDSTTGTIGDVIITSRGNDYTTAPTIWFWNAARTTAITCSVEIAENVSGGLAVVGSGELKLGAACTYTGDTVVSNACFTILTPHALPEGNTVKLSAFAANTTRMAVWTNNVTLAGFGGSGRLIKTSSNAAQPGSLRVTNKLYFDGAELAASKTFDATALSFTLGDTVSIEIANTNRLAMTGRAYPLMTVAAANAFTYTPELANLEKPWVVVRTDNNTKLKLVYSIGTVFILR